MYRTLLGVSKEFVLIGCGLRKRSVFILYFTHPHLFNENKLRTHTLQSKVRYFHVTPLAFSMRTNSVLTSQSLGKQGAVLSRYTDSLGTLTLLP